AGCAVSTSTDKTCRDPRKPNAYLARILLWERVSDVAIPGGWRNFSGRCYGVLADDRPKSKNVFKA
ncbi:MAG: hypothetical protein ACE5HI_18760, partial [bacterium]